MEKKPENPKGIAYKTLYDGSRIAVGAHIVVEHGFYEGCPSCVANYWENGNQITVYHLPKGITLKCEENRKTNREAVFAYPKDADLGYLEKMVEGVVERREEFVRIISGSIHVGTRPDHRVLKKRERK